MCKTPIFLEPHSWDNGPLKKHGVITPFIPKSEQVWLLQHLWEEWIKLKSFF